MDTRETDTQAHRDGTCLCADLTHADERAHRASCGPGSEEHCHCGDPSRAVVSKAAAAMGRAGRGASKVRGDSDHYRAIRAKRLERQYAVWMPDTPGAGLSAVAQCGTLAEARRIARERRACRPDLTWQDIQIHGKASGIEYAGPSR